ncbi:phage tail tape measure protein [Mycobacterium gordonae]|nr:phage tail tape measure protein [Mycobacterium gordonae]
MSDQLKIEIEALDKFQSAFSKLIKAVDDTAKGEDKLVKSTAAADDATAKFIRTVGDKGVTATAKMADQLDESADLMEDHAAAVNEAAAAQERLSDQTATTSSALGDLLAILGQIGIVYAFQRGLEKVIMTGAEFERTIRAGQVVTDDFGDTLEEMAMTTTSGVSGPTAMAKAYEYLGQVGLKTNEIVGSAADILDFTAAAQIDMAASAEAVISTAKSFQLEISRSGEITDAFTVAMNAGSLAGGDFTAIMGSAGAVAKMANQDYRQLLATISAMRDAGIGAQDAATSFRSALLMLINPTTESSKLMEKLGIDIYNSSGEMLQWHEIVQSFTTALAPYNQEARNLALSTVFGSDGIRAMATSMNVGSTQLLSLVQQMRAASGETAHVADVMQDTASGSIANFTGNIERLQVSIFDLLNPAFTETTDLLSGLAGGFAKLDDTTQAVLISLIGGAGLIIALSSLALVLRKVVMETVLLMATVGKTLFLNPWTYAAAAIGVVVVGLINFAAASEHARAAAAELIAKQKELTALLNQVDFNRSGEDLTELQNRASKEDELNAKYAQREALLAKLAEARARLENIRDIEASDIIGVHEDGIMQLERAIKGLDKAFTDLGFAPDRYLQQMKELKADVAKSVPALLEQRQAEIDTAIARGLQIQRLKSLKAEYDGLASKQSRNKEEQRRYNDVVQQLSDQIPSLVVRMDEYGNAHLDNAQYVVDRIAIEENAYTKGRDALIDWLEDLRDTTQQEANVLADRLENLRKFTVGWQKLMPERQKAADAVDGSKSWVNLAGTLLTGQNRDWSGLISKGLTTEFTDNGLEQQHADQQKKVAEIDDLIASLRNPKAPGGGKALDLGGDDKKGGGGGSALDGFRNLLQSIVSQLDPVRDKTAALSDAVGLLGAKEQYLAASWQTGKSSLKDLHALERVREEQLKSIKAHQEQLTAENVAAVRVQDKVKGQLTTLNAMYKSGKITAQEYADGKKMLSDELRGLEQDIRNNSQAWWADQSAMLAVKQTQEQTTAALKAERERRRDDVFSSSMNLMRHEVNLSRMSTEQQIKYLEILRDSHKWTQAQMWSIEEDLFNLREKQISDTAQLRKQDRDDAIADIRAEFSARKKAIEDEYALRKRQIDDGERERQRNALLEKADLYRLATSEQGQRTYRETLEELRKMDLEDSKQTLDDEKQEKLDALDEEEKAFIANLEKLQQDYERHGDDMAVLDKLAKDARVLAVAEGNKEIKQLWEDLARDYAAISSTMKPNADVSAPVFAVPTDTGAAYKSQLEQILQYKTAFALSSTPEGRAKAEQDAENVRKSLPAEIAALTRSLSTEKLRQYIASLSTGGKTTDEGLAYLHPQEVIVRAPVVRRIETMADLPVQLASGFAMLAAEIRALKLQVSIDKVIEVNNPTFEDGIDLGALGREAATLSSELLRKQYIGGG